MILARSTYNLHFDPDENEELTVNLWFKGGAIGDALGDPQRTLRRKIPTEDTTDIDIKINQFALDYLAPRPVWHEGTDNVIFSNPESQRFVTASYYFDDDEPDFKIQNILATKGWYNYLDGLNFAPTKRILTTAEFWQVKRGEWLMIPVLCNENASVKIIDGTNEFEFLIGVQSTIESRIRYVFFNTSNATGNYLTVRYESLSQDIVGAVIQLVDECKYEHQEMIFLNKYGAFQQLFTFKRSSKTITTTSDEFQNAFVSGGTYDKSKHQYKQINKQGRERVEVSTGFLKEEMNSVVEELLISEDVYLHRNGEFIPINIESNSLTYQTRKVDRLINYTLEYEFAFDKIVKF